MNSPWRAAPTDGIVAGGRAMAILACVMDRVPVQRSGPLPPLGLRAVTFVLGAPERTRSGRRFRGIS
jgi:hypothetical protein